MSKEMKVIQIMKGVCENVMDMEELVFFTSFRVMWKGSDYSQVDVDKK